MNTEISVEHLKARNPVHISRKVDACDWYDGDQMVCHERTYWGTSSTVDSVNGHPLLYGILQALAPDPETEYWSMVSMPKKEAERLAGQYGGIIREDYYVEPGEDSWFLVFSSLEYAYRFFSSDEHERLSNEKH